jgi:uncharacterized protein YhbP (UPF0306 family)
MMSVRLRARSFSEARVRRSLNRILGETRLCSLSTVGPGNRAHINTAYYAYSGDLDFFFLSDPSANHCRNLRRNPTMAMAVFRSTQTWSGPDRGVQLFGTGREATGRIATEAEQCYGRRFRLYESWVRGAGIGEKEADRLRSYRFYRFRPGRVKILDEREFGSAVFVLATIERGGRSR